MMMKKKQYVSPSVLRAAPFAPRASLLQGSLTPTSNPTMTTQGQKFTEFTPSTDFDHSWD